MDRDWGAPDALAFVRRTDFAPSSVAFDAAFSRDDRAVPTFVGAKSASFGGRHAAGLGGGSAPPHEAALLPPATAAASLPAVRRAAGASGSAQPPARRSDHHVVALVVEGGGMRGAVAAGMCLVLEAAGLMASFDRVYGCSSGAVTGAFAAAGQASLWATSFEDCACRTFIDRGARVPRRAGGRPRLPLRRGHRPAPAALRGRPGRRPRVPRRRRVGDARRAAWCCATSRARGPAGRRAGELRDPGADRRAADVPRRADGGRRPAGADPVSHGAARGRDPRARPALARRELPLAPPGPGRRAGARPRPS